ncbi:ALP1-like protein [Tanacetum coccineum]
MNQNNEDRQLSVFEIDANDDETDVVYLEQAYAYHQQLVVKENRLPLTRNLINHDREGAEERLMADYVNDHCRVRPDATGRMSLSVIMKCTTAIRQLAYGNTPDAFDEYLQMSERTARDCLTNFNKCIISLYMTEYLRKPTLEDVENIYNKHLTTHGFPGMLGSIDCMHWEWKKCPIFMAGPIGRGDKKYPTIMLEAVASQDLWIWHAFFGVAGANNDINVLDNSPLFDDLIMTQPLSFVCGKWCCYEKGYYLADGIYPQWATFVKSFTVANDAKHAYFKKASREFTERCSERAFWCFSRSWGIIQQPARSYHVNTIRRVMYSCIILHNMILKDQKMTVFDWNEVYANPSRNMQPYMEVKYNNELDAALHLLALATAGKFKSYGGLRALLSREESAKASLQQRLKEVFLILFGSVSMAGPQSSNSTGQKRKRSEGLQRLRTRRVVGRSLTAHGMPTRNSEYNAVETKGVTSSYINIGDCEWSCGHSEDQKVEYHKCRSGGKRIPSASSLWFSGEAAIGLCGSASVERNKSFTECVQECMLLSSSVQVISHQPSPFASLKSLKIYPLMNLEIYPVRLDQEQAAMEINLSTEVKSYLLDGSSNTTFTMVSREVYVFVEDDNCKKLLESFEDELVHAIEVVLQVVCDYVKDRPIFTVLRDLIC